MQPLGQDASEGCNAAKQNLLGANVDLAFTSKDFLAVYRRYCLSSIRS